VIEEFRRRLKKFEGVRTKAVRRVQGGSSAEGINEGEALLLLYSDRRYKEFNIVTENTHIKI